MTDLEPAGAPGDAPDVVATIAATGTPPPPRPNVLALVLAWSRTRPSWQRDALRRIVRGGTLRDEHVTELVALCKHENDITFDGTVPTAVPLAAPDIPQAAADGESVRLVRLRDLQHVNAIARGQRLDFAPHGLTVVYGDNGAGKSGYVRILKHLCRTRGSRDPVLPDVFAAASGIPTATLDYERDATPVTFAWTPSTATPPELGKATVFDASSGPAYVEHDVDVAFRPAGLDVFDRLVDACARVRAALERERRALIEQPQANFGNLRGPTAVGQLIESLGATTSLDTVRVLGNLTAEELERRGALQQRVAILRAEDPGRRIGALRGQRDRLVAAKATIDAISAATSDDSVRALQRDQGTAESAAAAARLASESAFSDAPLPGIGGPTWRALWEAARAYSSRTAYTAAPFPVVGEGALCVLCQQRLDAAARGRLSRFESFVKDETARRAEGAAAALAHTVEQFRATAALTIRPEMESEIASLSAPVSAQVRAFVTAAAVRRMEIEASLQGQRGWAGISPPAESPAVALDALAAACAREATALEQSAAPAERARAETDLRELDARVALSTVLPVVEAEIARQRRIADLERCIASTDTGAITKKSGELTAHAVTESLRTAFVAELAALSVEGVRVELVRARSQAGLLYHAVRLRSTSSTNREQTGAVLSEGEHRALALASLMTELALDTTRAPVVLDDPVSSLDHVRREHVATRLVSEAASGRQVVVFTHDIAFYVLLRENAEAEGVEFSVRRLRRDTSGAGISDNGVPWIAMKVNDRLARLRALHQAAAAKGRRGEREDYETDGSRIYGLLRESWERAVEEVLFGGVVERFNRSVQTQKLRRHPAIAVADYDAIERGMTRCSAWLSGHDQPARANTPFPTPDEMGRDIAALDDWVCAFRARTR